MKIVLDAQALAKFVALGFYDTGEQFPGASRVLRRYGLRLVCIDASKMPHRDARALLFPVNRTVYVRGDLSSHEREILAFHEFAHWLAALVREKYAQPIFSSEDEEEAFADAFALSCYELELATEY
jgi:hypothetical protein